jgi:hypothetical protein
VRSILNAPSFSKTVRSNSNAPYRWYFEDEEGNLKLIDEFRAVILQKMKENK